MEDVVRFGRYVLDRKLFQVREGGRVVQMERRAFDILVYLIEHRERVVSTDELLETIWTGRTVSRQSVSVAIALVRKALADDAKQPQYVATHVCRGYRFRASITKVSRGKTAAE